MLEILYRIYEVQSEVTEEQALNLDPLTSISQMYCKEIAMDCCICDTREQFKDMIRDTYGKDIPFRYSKKLQPGQVYCIIIGEHCYNTEKYFNQITFKCDFCGSEVTTYLKRHIAIDDYDIKIRLFGIQDYAGKKFCTDSCKLRYIEGERNRLRPDDDEHFFVTRDSFSRDCAGYIYKITKKSTGEFYVGQTIYVPIFRWGEHLHTDRFHISNLIDYQFEVIEIVPQGSNLLEREKYWIQTCYKECPEKSLNIACTKNITE